MRPSIFALSLSFGCLFSFNAFAQEPLVSPPIHEPVAVPVDSEPAKDPVFTVVEQMPEFEGGQAALMTFLSKNLQYPEDAREAEMEGKVYVRFVIEVDGHVRDVQVLRGVNGAPSLSKEAIRVVKLTDGKWKPGKQNGKPVPVQFTLPIVFKLQ